MWLAASYCTMCTMRMPVMNHHVKRLVNQRKAEYAKEKESNISNCVSQNLRIVTGIAVVNQYVSNDYSNATTLQI